MKTVIVWLLLTGIASAEDVVRYDSATGSYQGCRTIGDSRLWLLDPNDVATPKPGFLYASQCCGAVLLGVADRHRKVVNGQVVAMTQAERDAVEAPILAAQQQAQADTAELATLDATLDADEATLNSPTATLKDHLAVLRRDHRRKVLKRRLGR